MAAARSSWGRTEVTDPLGKAGPSFGNAWGQDGRGECLASKRPLVSQTRSSFWDTSAPSCCVSLLSPNKLLILIARPCSAFLLPWGWGWLSLGNQPAPWSHRPSIQPGGRRESSALLEGHISVEAGHWSQGLWFQPINALATEVCGLWPWCQQR